MDGFIDIHAHLLPGVDDGAPTISEALKLIRMAYRDGIRTIVLTPHYRGKYKQNTPEWLQEVFFVFSQMVAGELPKMKLYLGNEAYYEVATPELLAEKRILSINGSSYCLLEFSPGTLRSQILMGTAETVRNGFTPIIAHAERYDAFRKGNDLIDEVLALGALIQLNADSIMGKRGLRTKMFCARLLKEGKAHFVATDAHDEIQRPPLLRECFLYVYKKYGPDYAHRLFFDNAHAVIEDEVL